MFGFLKETNSNWESHRPLLYLALKLTDTRPNRDVIELGSGDGSTPYLKKHCEFTGRDFKSYDSNNEWATKTGAEFIPDWDRADIWKPCAVLFVDHAPGTHRKEAIVKMQKITDIIVAHDTELGGAGDYGFEPLWPRFKYVIHYNRTGGGAGATAVSNYINLEKYKGLLLGNYKLE